MSEFDQYNTTNETFKCHSCGNKMSINFYEDVADNDIEVMVHFLKTHNINEYKINCDSCHHENEFDIKIVFDPYKKFKG